MKKITILLIILVSVVLALAIQVTAGNYISARLATFPLVKQFNLFNPRAPIVVTNRETVRVSDSNDAVETANAVKSKLAVIAYYDQSNLIVTGGAINWTADGYLLSVNTAFGVAGKTYVVVMPNGEVYPIKSLHPDTASNLVMVATDARGLSTIDSVESKELRPGQKMLLVMNALAQNETTVLETYVRSSSDNVANVPFNSDRIGRFVYLQPVSGFQPGHAAVNLSGAIAGIYDGGAFVSTDALRMFANNFFRDGKQVVRPGYGFTYRYVSPVEARALQLLAGAQVTAVVPISASAIGGLQVGDVITAVNAQKVEDDKPLELLLSAIVPGDQVRFSVTRNANPTTLVLTTEVLK